MMPILPKSTAMQNRKPHQGRGGQRKHDSGFNYNTKAWEDIRALQLFNSPLCEECMRSGLTTTATVVDHIKQVKKGGAAMSLSNLQSLCKSCHNSKSGKEGHI
jgi:5-methylcytosine-specific restriction protein A